MSVMGVQQGSPFYPLLLCLSIRYRYTELRSAFCMVCLGDVTIDGTLGDILHDLGVIGETVSLGDILHDLGVIKEDAGVLGVALGGGGSGVVCENATIKGAVLCAVSG